MTFVPDLLTGKTALISGGGTGICRGLALALAAHGCDVAITSRKADHLEPTALEIEALGRRSLAVVADVRDPAAVDAAVERTVDELGRLDILVNGAAGNFLCLAENLSPNGFGAVVDIDLKGTFHLSKSAFPHLKEARGVRPQYQCNPSQRRNCRAGPRFGGQGRSRCADSRVGGGVGDVRHPGERDCSRPDRGHRGGEAPTGWAGEGARGSGHTAWAAWRNSRCQ